MVFLYAFLYKLVPLQKLNKLKNNLPQGTKNIHYSMWLMMLRTECFGVLFQWPIALYFRMRLSNYTYEWRWENQNRRFLIFFFAICNLKICHMCCSSLPNLHLQLCFCSIKQWCLLWKPQSSVKIKFGFAVSLDCMICDSARCFFITFKVEC